MKTSGGAHYEFVKINLSCVVNEVTRSRDANTFSRMYSIRIISFVY